MRCSTCRTERVAVLMAAYDETIREHELFSEIFGVI
jgi:hypothetical protein